MRKLALTTAGFAAAVWILVRFFDGVHLYMTLGLAAMAAASLFLLRCRESRVKFLLLGAALGALWCSGYTQFALAPAKDFCGEKRPFTAIAASCDTWNQYGGTVEADVQVGGRKVRSLLRLLERVEDIRPGDILQGSGNFTFTAAETEGDLYQPADGIFLMARVKDLVVTKMERTTFFYGVMRFALHLKERLHIIFPKESAGYFTAMVTGDRSGLSYGFLNDMGLCGLYHSVSLSGMHISVLMAVVLFLLGGKRRAALAFGVPLLVLFVMLSGVRPSTVRAVVMQSVMLFGVAARREYDPLTSLSTALMLLLLHNPWCIAQWGLQLSFASTFGILVLCPVMLQRMQRTKFRGKWLRKLYFAAVSSASVSVSATVAALPLMMSYFGVCSIVAPVTNFLALWSVMFSFVGGILLAALSFVSMPLAVALGTVLHLLWEYLLLVLRTFSALPFAAVYEEQTFLFLWSALWYGILTTVMCRRVRFSVPALCGLLTFAICFLADAALLRGDCFTVLDVGQGQCIVCIKGDATYLIDCGGRGEEAGETAARYLLSRGITRLDGVILTHFDTDHAGGVSHLLTRVKANALYYPARGEDTFLRRTVPEGAASCGTLCTAVDSPMTLQAETATLSLHPSVFGENDNELGLCILASAPKCDILVTGDLSAEGELVLLSAMDIPDLEVLVAGHHGSPSSTGKALLQTALPETVLISVGSNPYGHPSPKTLARIEEIGATAYTTQENGNLTVRW